MQIPLLPLCIHFYVQHLPKLYYFLFAFHLDNGNLQRALLSFIVCKSNFPEDTDFPLRIPLTSYLRVVIHNTRMLPA